MTDGSTGDLGSPGEVDTKSELVKRTINGVGLSLEEMYEVATKEVIIAKGVVAGLVAAGSVVAKVQNMVQAEVDAEKIEGEHAKLVLQWLQKAREELTSTASLNQREVNLKEGIVEGLKKATDRCESLHRQEDMKVRMRENEAARGNRDDGGRPLPIREQRGEAPVPGVPKKRVRRKKG